MVLVTVRVYGVVVVGLTGTPIPEVAGRLPGVIIPVPLLNTPVRVELPPRGMADGLAMKLVMVGSDVVLTVTVVVLVAVPPSALVTVRV